MAMIKTSYAMNATHVFSNAQYLRHAGVRTVFYFSGCPVVDVAFCTGQAAPHFVSSPAVRCETDRGGR